MSDSSFKNDIYKIDGKINELLVERTKIIEEDVNSNIAKLMLGKEASIIKKIIKKHTGKFPKIVLARIWREILGASASLNNKTHVAVLEDKISDKLIKITHEHFGSSVEYLAYSSVGQIMNAISSNEAEIGVIPADNHDINKHPWWISLKTQGENSISIIAKLPFFAEKKESDLGEAYVVAASKPDESGDDTTLISVEAKCEVSISSIIEQFEKLGFKNAKLVIFSSVDEETKFFLVSVDGFVNSDDSRLKETSELFDDIQVCGAYAKPIEM